MHIDDVAPYDGAFAVVETDRTWYLGTLAVDVKRETVTVYTGYTGRPPVLRTADLQELVLADEHPDVAAAC